MERTTVAVDLAKSVFEVAVANERGQITERKRCGRTAFMRFLTNADIRKPDPRIATAIRRASAPPTPSSTSVPERGRMSCPIGM